MCFSMHLFTNAHCNNPKLCSLLLTLFYLCLHVFTLPTYIRNWYVKHTKKTLEKEIRNLKIRNPLKFWKIIQSEFKQPSEGTCCS